MSEIKINSISQIETYIASVNKTGQELTVVMTDLKSAIDKASGVWHDSSIARAQADISTCISNMNSAYAELMPLIVALQAQVDWARTGASIC